MNRPLIIDARHRLRWHQRLFSDASTAMLWGVWLWLWSPLLRSASFADLCSRAYPTLMKAMGGGSVEDLQRSVVALVGTSGTLMMWSKIPAPRRRESAPPLSVRESAAHFDLPEEELHAARHASVCVVRHDANGRIVALECRDAAGSLQALSA